VTVLDYQDLKSVEVGYSCTVRMRLGETLGGVSAGDYYGRILVSASAANSPQLLTVVLTVLPVGASAGPEVRRSGLIFAWVSGVTPGSQDVTLGNSTAQRENYQSGIIGKGFTYLPTSADVPANVASPARTR